MLCAQWFLVAHYRGFEPLAQEVITVGGHATEDAKHPDQLECAGQSSAHVDDKKRMALRIQTPQG